jgi:predicted AlkP superfamily pyrophosphatase or phosphodiesterase
MKRKIFSIPRVLMAGIIFIVLLIVVILLIYFTVIGRGENNAQSDKYVVMISFDGFRWDYNKLYNTPNLNEVAKQGVMAERLIPSFPTKTFPNHYSIATGLYPDHHGLIDNSFMASDIGLFYKISDRDAVGNAAFYKGEPIWVTMEKLGYKTASFFWVGSEAPVEGKHPTYWKKYDESVTYQARIDTVIKWLDYPIKQRPRLVTLYFDEPDLVSHNFGPVSPETGKTVSSLDSIVGVIRNRLSKLPISDKIDLIILSDHGMGAISPDRYVNLKSVVPERMTKSITGGNPVFLIDPAEGKTDSALILLNKTKGIKAWKKTDVPARLHYGTNSRIPGIVVVADSSYSLGIKSDNSSIKGGAHGYDNSNSDMFAIFYAIGPSFKKNFVVKEMKNVDIYNLICSIFNIKPSPNDGNIDDISGLLNHK